MQLSQWGIIILRPTRVFLSFLASQLPGVALPELQLLQVDNTAYVIARPNNDEDMLNEIENHFSAMFTHEIHRWVGEHACYVTKGSFLDFLCCFKFELYSQIRIMEPALAQGRQLLCVKPRSVLFRWLQSEIEEQDELNVLERIQLSQLAENSTAIVKNFNELAEVESFLYYHYRSIFETEMLRICKDAQNWPMMDSYQEFNRYFTIEPHTQLVHL